MTITRVNKTSKILPVVESSYNKRVREGKEQREKIKTDAVQKIKDDAIELKRMENLIIPYLDNLQEQLVKKDLMYFWVFADEPGFVKIKVASLSDMQKYVNKDIDKYKNRIVASISILFEHNDDPQDNMCRKLGIYFRVDISAYPISATGIVSKKANQVWGATPAWYVNDFKLSKFSFKLIETITKAVVLYHVPFPSIWGYELSFIIDELTQRGVDFTKILIPLQ